MRHTVLWGVTLATLIVGVPLDAEAGPRAVAPLTPEECRAVADAFSKRLNGMTVSVAMEGAPSAVIDSLRVSGMGCAFTGTKPAKSMPRNYSFQTLDVPFFNGWEQTFSAASDATNGESRGWFRGSTVVVYDMHILVPEALCKGVRDFEGCEDKNWHKAIYTLKGNAFRLLDGGPITDADFTR